MAELVAQQLIVERGVDRTRAVDGVDLVVERGELIAIMGATGSGKSTLALALAGLVPIGAGTVCGTAVSRARLVLQRPESTFLAERVLDEVALAAIARGEPVSIAQRHARGWLATLGIDDDAMQRDPLALSGGEQRRVAVAATLSADAQVLLLDEPSAGLDRESRARLHEVLGSLHAAGRTIILVTHDPDEAALLATRLVVMRAGRVAWDGGVEPVLGDPQRAATLGLRTAPEVELLREVANARGVALAQTPATGAAAIEALADLLRASVSTVAPTVVPAGAEVATQPTPSERAPLPALVDARVRIIAAAIATGAVFASSTLLACAIVLACIVAIVLRARIDPVRLRVSIRPLLVLAVLLVALQLAFGGGSSVDLRAGVPATWTAAPALLRAMQASGVVLVSLALASSTTTLDLATGVRRLFSPLRLVSVPIGTLAFVVATGLGLVPAMADEFERLRLAQRARGLRDPRANLASRVRADTSLAAPLFVAAFRRAHLMADALAVRGVDPRAAVRPWRPMVAPSLDLLALAGGIGLLFVARFV